MKFISTLFRQLSLMVVLISTFSLSAWGQTTVEMTTFSATSASMDTVISYSTAKGGGTSNPAIYNGEIRLYQNSAGTGGGYITITATGNYTISSVTIGSSMATSVAHTIGSSTTKSSKSSLAKNGKHTISDINDQSVTIYCMGTASSSRLYVNYLSVTYSDNNSDPETPCTDPVISFTESTITKTNGDANFTNALNTGGSTGNVTYTTGDANIATVNATTGEVTIVGVGTTNIIATVDADDTYCEATVEYTLTVEGRTFDITWMNGADTHAETIYTEGRTLEFPVAPTPSQACQNAGWEFAGWSTSEITEDATSATLLTGTYTPTGDTKLYAVYKLEGTSSTGSAEAWALTDIDSISATDEVVITMTYTDGTIYALSSLNKASSAPTATTLTASNNNLSEAPADDLVWNISTNDSSYTIYPNGTTETWLYCFSDNNGVRVGTNANKTFIIDPTSGYLKNTETSRYLGVYRTNPDWRCYTNTTGNTANQTLGFYVKTGGTQTTITYNSNPNCETPKVATPTFIPENGKVDGENKFTEPFSLTIASATDDATIHYSTDGVNFNTYTTPITINTTTTIQAYATADGYEKSNIAEVTYTFIETHTVIWYDGEGTTEEKYTDGATLNLPITTPTSSHDEYNNFVGWTASPSGYSVVSSTLKNQLTCQLLL